MATPAPECYDNEQVNAAEAMTSESPMPTVLAVASVPYQSKLPEFSVDTVSHRVMPVIDAADENGPNVMAAVFVAEPPGDAAAPKLPVGCLV